MTPIDPNKSAFPLPECAGQEGRNGISTRTYLAGLAMQGILASEGYGTPGSHCYETLGERATSCADRLIAALNKTP